MGVFLGGGGSGSPDAYWAVSANTDETYISLKFADPGTQFPASSPLINKDHAKAEVYFNGSITVPNGSNYYRTNEVKTGIATMTYMTPTYASGTFYFDAENGNGELIHVIEGQFDIQF